jgi:hypothetical protein
MARAGVAAVAMDASVAAPRRGAKKMQGHAGIEELLD